MLVLQAAPDPGRDAGRPVADARVGANAALRPRAAGGGHPALPGPDPRRARWRVHSGKPAHLPVPPPIPIKLPPPISKVPPPISVHVPPLLLFLAPPYSSACGAPCLRCQPGELAHTSFGQIRPFGSRRLKVVEFLSALVQVEDKSVCDHLIKLNVPRHFVVRSTRHMRPWLPSAPIGLTTARNARCRGSCGACATAGADVPVPAAQLFALPSLRLYRESDHRLARHLR